MNPRADCSASAAILEFVINDSNVGDPFVSVVEYLYLEKASKSPL